MPGLDTLYILPDNQKLSIPDANSKWPNIMKRIFLSNDKYDTTQVDTCPWNGEERDFMEQRAKTWLLLLQNCSSGSQAWRIVVESFTLKEAWLLLKNRAGSADWCYEWDVVLPKKARNTYVLPDDY